MIFDALELMRMALEDYIQEVEELARGQGIVLLGNIAMAGDLGGTQDDMSEHIVMSLINMQEDVTLKNSPHYRTENGRTIYQNPPVNLNLYILFSALYSKNYDTALKRLSRVVEFFQWKKEFSMATTPGPNAISRDVRILPDLYTLDFDQLNQLWGSLGGKQVPFVMYRTRLVAIDAQKRQAEGEAITQQDYNLRGGR